MTARTRKPPEAVQVEAYWLADAPNGNRQFVLNGVVYELQTLEGGFRLFRFRPDGEIAVYDIDPSTPWGWQCDCPDATFRGERPGGCKHVRGLQQLLALPAAA